MALVKIYKQVNGGGALSTLDIGVTPITGGSVGGVLFEGTGNVLQESANLFWDNTNSRLGIGTISPGVSLDVNGTIRAAGGSGTLISSITQTNIIQTNGGNIVIKGSGGASYATLFQTTGNLVLQNTGAATDAGFRLDVNGTARVQGNTTTQNILVQTGATYDIGVSATRFRDGWFSRNVQCGSVWTANIAIAATNLTFNNNSAAVLGTLFGTGNLLLSTGTQTDAGYKLDVNGTARFSDTLSFTNTSTLSPQGTTAADRRLLIRGGEGGAVGSTSLITLTTNGNITSTSGNPVLVNINRDFAPTSGTATYTLASITGVINQTGGANGITRGLYINPTLTSAADFRAIEVASGITILGAATTAKASLRIPSGTAPTSPVNGDIWFDGTNIKMQIGGVTKTFTLI